MSELVVGGDAGDQRSATEFAKFDYTLNAVGNRTSKTQSGTGILPVYSESYSYDAVDQITGVDYSTNSIVTRSVAYVYDGVGNRQQTVDVGGSGSITTAYTANRRSTPVQNS